MGDLINKKIKDTFAGIIKTSDEEVIDASGRSLLEDGRGNDSALSIGRVNNGISVKGDSTIIGVLEVSNRIETDQVRVESSLGQPGLMLEGINDGSNIRFFNGAAAGSDDAYIQTNSGNVGIGGKLGNSTQNLNIKTSNGYVGIKQKAPLAPLHIKRNGEAIRLESTGDNVCSIDFRQGTNKRGHIEFDNTNDTLEIQTQNPTGATSKIKFSVAKQGQDPEEVMRIQSTTFGRKQVVIGNIPSVYAERELFVSGDAEVTRDLWVGRNAEIDGRCHADSFKVEGLNTAPGSATSEGKEGEIRYTADYIYVCVSENNWKRTALTSF